MATCGEGSSGFRDEMFVVWSRNETTKEPIPPLHCNGSWIAFGCLVGLLVCVRLFMLYTSVMTVVRMRARSTLKRHRLPLAPLLDFIHTIIVFPTLALVATNTVSARNGSSLPLLGVAVGAYMASAFLFTVKLVHVSRKMLPNMASKTRKPTVYFGSKTSLLPALGISSSGSTSRAAASDGGSSASGLQRPDTVVTLRSAKIKDDPTLLAMFSVAAVCIVGFVVSLVLAPVFPLTDAPRAVGFSFLAVAATILELLTATESYFAARDLREHVAGLKDSQRARSTAMVTVSDRLVITSVVVGIVGIGCTTALACVASGTLKLSYIATILLLFIPSMHSAPGYYLMWRKRPEVAVVVSEPSRHNKMQVFTSS